MPEKSDQTVYVTYARCTTSGPGHPDPIEQQQALLRDTSLPMAAPSSPSSKIGMLAVTIWIAMGFKT